MSADDKDALSFLATGWDAGYDAAVALMEAGMFRLVAQGPKGLAGMSRPKNPYRVEATR